MKKLAICANALQIFAVLYVIARGNYSTDADNLIFLALFGLGPVLSIIVLVSQPNEAPSFIGLRLRRYKLEEEARITALEEARSQTPP